MFGVEIRRLDEYLIVTTWEIKRKEERSGEKKDMVEEGMVLTTIYGSELWIKEKS